MKMGLLFVLIGFLVPFFNRKGKKWDVIYGELLGIGFVVILSYFVYGEYGWETFEPWRVGKFLILGYLPWRVVGWLF